MRLGVATALVDGRLVPGDVIVEDGRVVAVGASGSGRGTAVPGFVDLQVNGFGGVDLLGADLAGWRSVAEGLAVTGVTAYRPTLVSAPEADLVRALGMAGGAVGGGSGAAAEALGVHLEGPFLSPERPGAHPPDALRAPDAALAERLLDAGPVAHVTLAPELPGALGLVDLLRARGATVAVGHTDATAEEAHRAFDRGARTVTHLWNAMRPLAHRDPGVVGAALARADVGIQLIADGVHVADDVLLLTTRAAPGRVAAVSDAIAAAGVGDGGTRLGAVELEVSDGVARRADGTLAGGTGSLAGAIRRLCSLGVALPDAVAAASTVPARQAGRSDLGLLEPGARADLVVLDDRLEVVRVLCRGEPVG